MKGVCLVRFVKCFVSFYIIAKGIIYFNVFGVRDFILVFYWLTPIIYYAVFEVISEAMGNFLLNKAIILLLGLFLAYATPS